MRKKSNKRDDLYLQRDKESKSLWGKITSYMRPYYVVVTVHRSEWHINLYQKKDWPFLFEKKSCCLFRYTEHSAICKTAPKGKTSCQGAHDFGCLVVFTAQKQCLVFLKNYFSKTFSFWSELHPFNIWQTLFYMFYFLHL